MIDFPQIRTARVSVALKELTLDQAIALCRIPSSRHEEAISKFLKYAAAGAECPTAGYVVDQRMWTVSERLRLVVQYLMGVADDGPDFSVGKSARLSSYIDFTAEAKDLVLDGIDVGAGPMAMRPLLPYGCSLGHSRRWPGTIAVQPITLIELVKQIGDGAYHSGVRRLFIVNTHVTNAAPLRCALEMLRAEHDDLMVAVINSPDISERVRAFHFADAVDWHANDAETSLMLAVSPEMVRPDKLSEGDDPDRTAGQVFAHPVNRTSANGVTGFPSRATAEKGREAFAWMVEDLSALIRKGLLQEPPLPHSYFEPCWRGSEPPATSPQR